MRKNILATGGLGFIGSHTVVELEKLGYNVIVADNLSNSSIEVLDNLNKILGHRPAFFEIDITDKRALKRIFDIYSLDAVIHFAGYKAVGESVKKPVMYYRNNLDSTLTLLELMAEYNVRNIIFSSSATVYGGQSHSPFSETSDLGKCTNPYGWTKYMIEQILKDTAKANPDMSVILLRYFNPIGAHTSGLLGEKPTGIPNNLMPYINQVASGRLPKLYVFGDDYPTHDGTGVRDYIHVVDLAQGHAAALHYAEAHKGVEIFNLGTGTGYSVLDLVHAFEKVNRIKIPYEIAPRREGDIASCYADVSKANKVLGWHANKTIEDMCRDSWLWEQKREHL